MLVMRTELSRKPSRVDICVVFLDGFRVQQQVIWLPCAHRYHSSCVLPWLSDHSHCPYCRTEVPSLELLSDNVL
ncbi:E3 ubiquitin-protein ligase RING1 [Dendrobium catenatum]|uniref:E3 ubiquitin-protein ligase RING1 n=1 Tax=Dendrobium catenatum TaxID=906689 RepID=A0A2I0XDF8_9ASPA|nr:E3 ubiquitin-protein ligase RING1 [Dendrobium catenatum]